MTDEPDVLIVLRPVADPASGPGRPPRDAPYRLKVALKVLLRSYGLRCISISDVRTELVTPTEQEMAHANG